MDGTIPGRGLGGGLGEHSPAGAGRGRTFRAAQSPRDAAGRRCVEQYRLSLRHRAGGALRRLPAAAASPQGVAAVAGRGLRRFAAGAGRGQNPGHLLLRLRVGLFLGAVRPGDPQRVARPRVDEARHSGRVLHQDRCGVPRRHDPFQRRDEIGGLRTRAGLPRGGRRVVLRLPVLAPHEGRRAFGDDSCERALDLRRLGFDHRGARGRRRRPETFVYRFAGADRRRADDLPHAVAGEPARVPPGPCRPCSLPKWPRRSPGRGSAARSTPRRASPRRA